MSAQLENGSENDIYIDTLTFKDYLQDLRERWPDLYTLLDPARIDDDAIARYLDEMNRLSWEFEGNEIGGRGAAYNKTNLAQQNYDNRSVGMISLIKCFSPAYDAIPGADFRILDVLGGGGTVARFFTTLGVHAPTIVTADLSNLMISACRAKHLPYIRQSAGRSLFRDDALDGVLIAYGSQLLDLETRQLAVSEAHRTVKPGHRLVLHTFEIGDRVANFFDEVVHPYSRTGHPNAHFTRPGLLELLTRAGFRDIRLFEMADPFVLRGATPEEARRNAIRHVYGMYDLIKVAGSDAGVEAALEPLIEKTLGPISISRERDHYVAEIPRATLIAVGTKAEAR